MQFTITLTEAEAKALAHVALDPNEWIQNAVHEQCRIAIEQIVASEVKRKFDAGEAISGTKAEIVMAAQIESAAERSARLEAEQAALAAQ